MQIILDTASFSNRKVLESTVFLIRLIFEQIKDDDVFGLRVLKCGYKVEETRQNRRNLYQRRRLQNEVATYDPEQDEKMGPDNQQLDPDYYDDILLPEQKSKNTVTKLKYLCEFTARLHDQNKNHWSTNRITNIEAAAKSQAMKRATTACLENAINYLKGVTEYNIEEMYGSWIVGPMKWLFYIVGPNHEAKDLKSLLA